jgi:hypothetical protein
MPAAASVRRAAPTKPSSAARAVAGVTWRPARADGRLTSAWNWCSVIEKKPYYNIFLLTGFQGFDGKW